MKIPYKPGIQATTNQNNNYQNSQNWQSPQFSQSNSEDSYAGTLSNTSLNRNGDFSLEKDDGIGEHSVFAPVVETT